MRTPPIFEVVKKSNMMQDKLPSFKGIDIFCGAGGMSCGAGLAGVDIELAVEFNKDAAATFKHNHPDVKVLIEDIIHLNPRDYVSQPVFVVFGGPPCQGFSLSNTKTRNIDNANNKLYKQFIRFVEELQPEWFVFENVEGFQRFDKGSILRDLEGSFNRLGYKTNYSILCSSDYGVPQKRKRFFMVGNRKNIDYSFPKAYEKQVTVFEAIHDLPNLVNGDKQESLAYACEPKSDYVKRMRGSEKYATQNFISRNAEYVVERYKYIEQGQNWRAIPKEMLKNYKDLDKCHGSIYRRLNLAEPSVIISNYRKNMLIHPTEDRGLSVREAARLQSFPDKYQFKGELVSKQVQIGNAVPPELAHALFTSIIQAHQAFYEQEANITLAL